MTDDEIKAECERRFQAGGDKTQVVSSGSNQTLFEFVNGVSVPYALRNRFSGERVFARRRSRNPANSRVMYVWKEFK